MQLAVRLLNADIVMQAKSQTLTTQAVLTALLATSRSPPRLAAHCVQLEHSRRLGHQESAACVLQANSLQLGLQRALTV